MSRVEWERLFPAEIDCVVTVPDSMLTPVVRRVVETTGLDYLQTVHESQAVAVAVGLALAGRRPLVCMENSGLRAAGETIARLVVLHQLPLLALVSDRGGYGDPNWWAQHHSDHMRGLISLFALVGAVAATPAELTRALRGGLDVVATRMRAAVVVATPELLEGLRRELG
ncbi:thiamine pyrophosphate-binding protein [Micromonospora sp. NPDC049559]|uniref:thiamine pyrophosphate-binding protein n=1 Tax=Micromonospora sp. NPDC049559 TaxID=3155923 RepID=UPI003436179E